MKISLKGVFLGQKDIKIKKEGKEQDAVLGEFHQPNSKDNSLIPVVLPTGQKLEQYKEYVITGDLSTWSFNNKVGIRVTAIDIKLT